ncbi:MAG: peptidylprolyl isomerase [Pegethrix bostrychoides GSE-TBD4-15B]|jgi:parvulin-like peptidyl-prolyl isomerase|uniref:peptidylprolyl isomerase n=1 Tax=Pegethrix bostrychoides GSE-TBD4-15B TaxID=2839662 RepID=A0A951PAL9_9CYAN|nr:peptidylprolyl isomerase [Pegethrix bostrychoides GSE-TBD4-15B]
MTGVLQIGNRSITAEELLPLMAGYQMLPQFLQEILIDEAIQSIECSPEEAQEAAQQFYTQNQLTSDEERQTWLQRQGMTQTQLDAVATRELRLEKFKLQTWGAKLESYFLTRKDKLDKVIYSLIRTKDIGIAQELYFRILEGEQSFAELARSYSQGPEAQTDGLIGPVELSVPHPTLAQILTLSQPGQISPPTRVGDWLVLVRLERFIPAQMDESMRQRLLNECFNSWMQERLSQLDMPIQSAQPADAIANATNDAAADAAPALTSTTPTPQLSPQPSLEKNSEPNPALMNAVTPTAS